MSGEILPPKVASCLVERRQVKARAEADRIDCRFFNRNPTRWFHIREALPFESSLPPPGSGMAVCLVMREGKTAHRRWFPVPDLSNYPNDEAFLARLWARVCLDMASGIGISISGEEMKQMLVDTGHWKEPA